MKTSLDHLPEQKRDQLTRITELLRENAPVEMVILFGSYARGDWVEDLPNQYFSDYDLLVVVEEPAVAENDRLWDALTGRAKKIAGRVPVTILVHDIKQLNREIRRGRYFFSDVLPEGIALHDSRRFMLAKPKATARSSGRRFSGAAYAPPQRWRRTGRRTWGVTSIGSGRSPRTGRSGGGFGLAGTCARLP